MTDEERQKLITNLREPWGLCDDVDADLAALMTRSADELERLAQRLAELEQRDRDIANDIRALARWI